MMIVNDKELALELMKIYQNELKGSSRDAYVSSFHKILESIREYKSETTLGKMEELIDEYDSLTSYCDFNRTNLIDKFRKLIKNDKEN